MKSPWQSRLAFGWKGELPGFSTEGVLPGVPLEAWSQDNRIYSGVEYPPCEGDSDDLLVQANRALTEAMQSHLSLGSPDQEEPEWPALVGSIIIIVEGVADSEDWNLLDPYLSDPEIAIASIPDPSKPSGKSEMEPQPQPQPLEHGCPCNICYVLKP